MNARLLQVFGLPSVIGMRYLRSKKSNRSISFFTLVSLLGITIGVAAVVIVLSVMNGFEKEMHQRILGVIPHTSIENRHDADAGTRITLENWQVIASSVMSEPRFAPLLRSAAPYVEVDGLLNKNSQVQGVRVLGVDSEAEKNASIIPHFILAGDFNSLARPEQNIVIGSDLARSLGLMIGDSVTLMFPQVEGKRLSSRYFPFTVTGFFDVGAEADALLAMINIEDAAQLKHGNTQIDGIRFQLKHVGDVDVLESPMQDFFAGQFVFDTWKSRYGQLFQTVKLEKVMTGAMLMLIVLVAAFNTVSSLSMLVAEKHSSIAVLRTMGFTARQVVAIFFVQGLFISGLGVLMGLLSGVLIAIYLESIIVFINNTGLMWIAPLKSVPQVLDIVFIAAFAFLISLLASILPARLAARVEPADAVRYQ